MSTERFDDDRHGDDGGSGVTIRTRRSHGPQGGDMPMQGYGGGWGHGGFRPRTQFPIETKPFFLTSEFFGVLLLIAAMAIGAASHEDFDSRLFWILTTALGAAYVLSRGIAKSGTRSRAVDPREELFRSERGRDD